MLGRWVLGYLCVVMPPTAMGLYSLFALSVCHVATWMTAAAVLALIYMCGTAFVVGRR